MRYLLHRGCAFFDTGIATLQNLLKRGKTSKPPWWPLSLLRFLFKMKHVSYNGYVITVTANNEKGTWRSHVIITWYAGKFDLHDEVSFTTEMEAEEHAVESGKHWVNNRLQILKGSS